MGSQSVYYEPQPAHYEPQTFDHELQPSVHVNRPPSHDSRPPMYGYQPLEPGEIRLLQPMESAYPLACHMVYVSLDSPSLGPFSALSYTWEGQEFDREIICNGKRLLVSENVYNYMNVWRNLEGRLPLWIDAVCINQKDMKERENQVKLMTKIYSMAEYVTISLGESNSDIDAAMAAMPLLKEKLIELDEVTFADPFLSDVGLPPTSSEVWRGLGALFSHSYFSRTWTIQEYVLAQTLLLRLGSTHYISAYLELAVRFLFKFSALSGLEFDYKSLGPGGKNLRQIIGELSIINRFRHRREERRISDYSEIMLLSRNRSCTDPRDKVYGLVGLMPQGIRDRIAVNYAIPIGELYKKFAKAWLLDSMPLTFFYHCYAETRLQNTASWCPNLSDKIKGGVFGCFSDSDKAWTVSGTSKADLVVIEGYDLLAIGGFRIDEIATVVSGSLKISSITNSKRIAELQELYGVDPRFKSTGIQETQYPDPESLVAVRICEERCMALAREMYKEEETAREAHIHTLLMELFVAARIKVEDTPEAYRNWKQYLNLQQMDCVDDIYTSNFSKWQPVVGFLRVVGNNVGNRSYLATKGGRVGLGSRLAQPGDLVCIFYGAQVPMLLRPTSNGRFILMDEVYVHGLLQGEAIQLRDQLGIADETFLIE